LDVFFQVDGRSGLGLGLHLGPDQNGGDSALAAQLGIGFEILLQRDLAPELPLLFQVDLDQLNDGEQTPGALGHRAKLFDAVVERSFRPAARLLLEPALERPAVVFREVRKSRDRGHDFSCTPNPASTIFAEGLDRSKGLSITLSRDSIVNGGPLG